MALLVTLALVIGLEYTRFGAQVRASVDNQRMARGIGIDVDRTFALRPLRSARGSPPASAARWQSRSSASIRISPFTYLVYVLIVVSVGGLGSIAGSFAAAILIGISDIAGKYYVPELGAFLYLSGDGGGADVEAGRPVRESAEPWPIRHRRMTPSRLIC